MKLGLILECPKQGTDHQVYQHIISQLCPGLALEIVGSVNKREMIQDCGEMAKLLLESDQCDHVAIIWDLMPRWGGRACRKDDVEAISSNLRESNVPPDKIKLICIEPELEAIFLADGNILTAYKQSRIHPRKPEKKKDENLRSNSKDAKKRITKYLGKYNDVDEALKIAKHIRNYDKIARKTPSFARLKSFVDENCPKTAK